MTVEKVAIGRVKKSHLSEVDPTKKMRKENGFNRRKHDGEIDTDSRPLVGNVG